MSQQRVLSVDNIPLMKQSSAFGLPSHVQASTAPDIPAINGEQIAKKIAKVGSALEVVCSALPMQRRLLAYCRQLHQVAFFMFDTVVWPLPHV